jgi:hypothetical protein
VTDIDLFSALARGGGSAVAVTALLLAAQRWGQGLAGLLAGMPTVTGPALVWLALDRGSDFAGQAANGAVAAAVPCAVFALTYARLAPRRGRLAALCWACASCLPTLALLATCVWPLPWALTVAAITCMACLTLMPRRASHPAGAMGTGAPGAVPRRDRWALKTSSAAAMRAGLATVLVAGSVSAIASLSAQALGPKWAGILTSPPLLAAAVVLELHRQGCPRQVQDFLRGYTSGLLGRSAFVAVFGAMVAPLGWFCAVWVALLVALAMGWANVIWMQRRSRSRSPSPALPSAI